MFYFFKRMLDRRKKNKQRLKYISFLFKGGYYIFWQDTICRLTPANINSIGLLRSLLFLYRIPKKEIKKEHLVSACVKTGNFKHAVISEKYCYLVFKQKKHYYNSKKNYFSNINSFNYPTVHPFSYYDDLLLVIEPKVDGRPLKTEELPQLLAYILELFKRQSHAEKDENGIIHYVQHNDPLPGNSLILKDGSIFFVDLDGIMKKPALCDFFNVICRTQGFDLLLNSRELFKSELKSAFKEHDIEYTESVYDLYLSKFVEMRILEVKNGFNGGVLYKSMEWILNPIIKKEFPITYELVNKYDFSFTNKEYILK